MSIQNVERNDVTQSLPWLHTEVIVCTCYTFKQEKERIDTYLLERSSFETVFVTWDVFFWIDSKKKTSTWTFMDKLKKVLSGQDGNDDLNVLQVI